MLESWCDSLSVFLRESAQQEDPPFRWSLEGALFPVLRASSVLYGGVYQLRMWLYKVGVCKRESLPVPVISVGNISWGGNGKTPMVEFIARRMLSVGLRPVVLVRGGPYSDEASMLTQRLRDTSAVIGSGRNRSKAARTIFTRHGAAPSESVRRAAMSLAIAKEELDWEVVGTKGGEGGVNGPVGVVIVDDGMQHLALDRDLEIVMVSAVSYFGNGHLIPSGPLREPLSALQRADAVILHHADLVSEDRRLCLTSDLHRHVRPSIPVFPAHFAPKHLLRISGPKRGRQESLDAVSGVAVVALSGIGCPRSLELLLYKLGAKRVESRAFGDHHVFFEKDLMSTLTLLRGLQDSRQYSRCLVITTEKDFARCSRVLEDVLFDADCFALIGSLELDAPSERLDALLSGALRKRTGHVRGSGPS
ncbi:hypothetical protein KFL_000600220 [Klebsormidium nitens]|uniref:tetraacyldisaccharide 4'-kinase n=1 Tax=Klebsormidium nitens TaxID=105231 RepID=A0A1Y1HQ01_KLENI|nr:hypothetical protein KFL_000600220 [Klebsormidium nitens]|eukprot:GAQ80705.1 hypothetical protein KFL_000600220 [Klebsormidium nitens]